MTQQEKENSTSVSFLLRSQRAFCRWVMMSILLIVTGVILSTINWGIPSESMTKTTIELLGSKIKTEHIGFVITAAGVILAVLLFRDVQKHGNPLRYQQTFHENDEQSEDNSSQFQ